MIGRGWISQGIAARRLNSPHSLVVSANRPQLLTIQKPDAESFYLSDTPAGHTRAGTRKMRFERAVL